MTREVNQCSGCGARKPTWLCVGYDYSPHVANRRGKRFKEKCCDMCANYLADCSAELGFPFTKARLAAKSVKP